jgi:hypothetical protein
VFGRQSETVKLSAKGHRRAAHLTDEHSVTHHRGD